MLDIAEIFVTISLALDVRKVDNTLHYPLDKSLSSGSMDSRVCFVNTYPLASDFSSFKLSLNCWALEKN